VRGSRSAAALLGAFLVAALVAGCGEDQAPDTTPSSDAREARANERPSGTRGERPPVGDGRGGVRLVEIGRFDQPLFVTEPPGARDELYVVEQCGRVIRVVDGEPDPGPFLDLSGEVSCGGERGLLSIAFAPDYGRSGRLYVDYTDTEGDTRVVEYRRTAEDRGAADPASARLVLSQDQPFPNHNGGLLLFGPDELLYVGLGDGGSAGDPQRNGQDLSTLLAKILRIDPRGTGSAPYSVPGSNPFVDTEGALGEIYAYGLRNPWRFSFDRATEALWIGDVGQDSLEEVDSVVSSEASGANFGWSAYEGDERFNADQEAPGHVPPVFTYSTAAGENCSITGGYVVRDARLKSLYGRYLYGDFCAGELRSFSARPGRTATDDRPLGLTVPSLSSFGEDGAGRIYATSLEGPVYRLDPAE
jgi:glucose/arabinose dehydrogenase